MKWKETLRQTAVAVCAGIFFISPAAFAEGDDAAPTAAADGGEAANSDAAPAQENANATQKEEKFFYPLVRCDEISGATMDVLKPRGSTWTRAVEGKYYPLGSSFRVTPAVIGPTKVSVAFGMGSYILITNATEFATREIAIGDPARVVELRKGILDVSLPRTLKDGLFSVAAPHFTCCNMAGDSRFEYMPLDDGDEAVIRVITGSLALKGRHYEIARMGVANQIRIRTTKDALFTSIRGESGDSLVKLDQGLTQSKDYETGEVKETTKTLDFQLSPLCAIKIFRKASAIGGRMAVSIMTFIGNGQMTHRCAFAENRSNVNSGELVVSTTALKEGARKAGEAEAEATEAVDVAVPTKGAAAEAPAADAPAEAPAADAQQNDNEEKPASAPEQKEQKGDDDF